MHAYVLSDGLEEGGRIEWDLLSYYDEGNSANLEATLSSLGLHLIIW